MKADKERRASFRARADAAVEEEGHPKGKLIVQDVKHCRPDVCEELLKKFKEEAPAAINAGLALRALVTGEGDAGKFLIKAEQAAKRSAAARRAKNEQQKAEEEQLNAELVGCEKVLTACSDR